MGPVLVGAEPEKVAADFAGRGAFSAARISARTIRPPGPEPVTVAGSIRFSSASLRASGEILMRPVDFGGVTLSSVVVGVGAASPDFDDGSTAGCAWTSFFDVVEAPTGAD